MVMTAQRMEVFSFTKDVRGSLRSVSFFTLCPKEQGFGRELLSPRSLSEILRFPQRLEVLAPALFAFVTSSLASCGGSYLEPFCRAHSVVLHAHLVAHFSRKHHQVVPATHPVLMHLAQLAQRGTAQMCEFRA